MSDSSARTRALARQSILTKPAGSLGVLEELAVQLADVQQSDQPSSRPAATLLFAADHPVAALGVSAYPPAVTRAMLANFVGGGAASSVLARTQNVSLSVIDVGVLGSEPVPGTIRTAVADMAEGDLINTDAMSVETFRAAQEAGEAAVKALPSDVKVLILGEMGIGNTTLASAVAAATLGASAQVTVGRGTGVDDEALARKRSVVASAVARVGNVTPLEALRRLGGRELAAMAGATEAAAARNLVVLVDGVVVTAALLGLLLSFPQLRRHCIFAHHSADASHQAMLRALDVRPLLDLNLRLGEGTGALTALPLLDSACRLHNEMSTFEQAAVPGRES
jgi:nicotinate-nucleotide--dimethylbenzimidazole phosphoribosyltransferase